MNDDTNGNRLPNNNKEYNYNQWHLSKLDKAKNRLNNGLSRIKAFVNQNNRSTSEISDLNNVLMAFSALITSMTRLHNVNKTEYMTQEQLLDYVENALHNASSNIRIDKYVKPDYWADREEWKYLHNVPPTSSHDKKYDLDLVEELANLLIKIIADMRKKQ